MRYWDRYNCPFQTKDSCLHGFSEYIYLGQHVRTEHPEIGAMLKSVVPETAKENEDMPLPNAGAPRQGGRSGGDGGTGLPYLKADMLSTQPKEVRILMVRNEPKHRFGPSVVVKLELEGKSVLWTLHVTNNPNFGILRKKFGGDENEWADKTILLVLEQDEFSEQYNIRTHFPEAGKKK
jgi:hypothetical protein